MVSITLFIPLVGAVLLLSAKGATARLSHGIGIVSSLLTLAAALGIWMRGTADIGFSQVEQVAWIPSIDVVYRVGVDGISLPLVLLTAVLFVAAFVFSLSIRERARVYVLLFLLLETASIGTFVALDGILFYVFFEVSLVAMYFIIVGWGHEDRRRAALTFFLYTLLGSLPLLLAILGLYLGSNPHTFDMRSWIELPPLHGLAATWALIAMLVTFAVKIPAVPLHTWLPAAHVQAPAAGSLILAGVMLKFGTYGLVRFALQMNPEALRQAYELVLWFGVLGALYGVLAALAQTDLKRLVAYTSVNHMGYVVMAVAVAAGFAEADTRIVALDGAVLQMVSHGLVTGALFLLVGAMQERTNTRELGAYGGLLKVTPVLSWSFVIAAFASLGLPGLAHFPAEFQIFLATLQSDPAALVAVLGIVLTAAVYLKVLGQGFMGSVPEALVAMHDLSLHERVAVGLLLALIVIVGVAPFWVLDMIHRSTSAWIG